MPFTTTLTVTNTPPTSGTSASPIGITLLGCGIVASGVLSILHKQADLLRQRTGLSFSIRHIVVRDTAKAAQKITSLGLPDVQTRHLIATLSTSPKSAIEDPQTHLVVELLGGTTTAGDLITRALTLGKPVVTANKALLALRGPQLLALAKQHQTSVAFEASVAGGIPIIHAITHGLCANRIDSLTGIVNGTCNFILSKMTNDGLTYADALKQAQDAGFAEADPAMDVTGRDAAQKLALLASLAFSCRAEESHIQTTGIDTLSPLDIRFAKDLGYVIKLLATARRYNSPNADLLALSVRPTLVPMSDVLATVSGSFNAVSLFGSALGHAVFYGRGAGSLPTASAVVSDIIHSALGFAALTTARLSPLSEAAPSAPLLNPDLQPARFYLRLTALDQPGVLAQVTKALGDAHISIASFLQHEAPEAPPPHSTIIPPKTPSVPLVLTTHTATFGAVRRAVELINALPPITGPTVCLPILDNPAEFAPLPKIEI